MNSTTNLASPQLTEDAALQALLRPLELALDESDRILAEQRARQNGAAEATTDSGITAARASKPLSPPRPAASLVKDARETGEEQRASTGTMNTYSKHDENELTNEAAPTTTVAAEMMLHPVVEGEVAFARQKIRMGKGLGKLERMALEAKEALHKAQLKRERGGR
jgi:hypothetical protein